MDYVRIGAIKCCCDQSYHFETIRNKVSCIKCGKEHDVSAYQFKVEPPSEEGEPDGTAD